MFAPRHAVAAAELARVLRQGGRLGICSWTPEGAIGAMLARLGGYMPPPSPLAEPPILWGVEDHVEELFAGSGIAFAFDRALAAAEPFESADAGVAFLTAKFGPLMMARQLAEASGRWPELRADLAEMVERNEPGEYLVALGRKGG